MDRYNSYPHLPRTMKRVALFNCNFMHFFPIYLYRQKTCAIVNILVTMIKTLEVRAMTKILLVEDDAMIASGITYALEMEGYEATSVTNISDALTAIQRMTFDLAILDMQLPDGTGFDVSDQLKKQPPQSFS